MADLAHRLQRQLDAAQQITHIGSWEWDLASGQLTWSDELYRIYGLAPRACEITLEGFLGRVHPDDRERVQREVSAAIERGGRFAHRERILRPDGSVRELDTIGEVLADDQGRPTALVGTCRDVTEDPRERAVRTQVGERRTLELLAAGAALGDVLAEITRYIEELVPGAIASVLRLDDSGTRMVHGAAPNLPAEYNQAIDGQPIGPQAGSCGTAAFRRAPVLVSDIEIDPLWEAYRDLVRPLGLRACWSYPILSSDGSVLGTFAVYWRAPRVADPASIELLARAAHVAGIAIERRRLDERMRALTERIEAIREDERTSVAREIHDELGQSLTALKMDVAWLGRRLGGDRAVADKLTEMSAATDAVIQAVRRISAELRPGILDDLGLQAAVEWQVEEFTRRTGIACALNSRLGDVQLERELATAVFRIFQEALTNITRHAGATQVTVQLGLERGQVALEVVDDGVGLPEAGSRGGSLGLLGMGERARRLGGECRVTRREPGGTLVSLRLPLRFPPEPGPEPT
ncbi:MAG TPA: GAF domain-containing protein [Kofleriaceae bacterium]|nr:GAF domain-containing protein [Kofleriaceae bacterium]